jgi:hypothetical protein
MSNTLSLSVVEGEPCVDSRIVSNELAVDHKSARKLIEQYRSDFEELGVWRFEIAKPSRETLGGRPEKFYLLNEDQTYFLMTLVRNTDEAVQLKKRLVKAFAQFRIAGNPLELAPVASVEVETLRTQLAACHTELMRLKPMLGKLCRYQQAGLNQREIALLFGWASRDTVRIHTRHAEKLGLLSRPENRQLALLEG